MKNIFYYTIISFLFINSLLSQNDLNIIEKYYGKYDFTILGNTMSKRSNSDPNNSCEFNTESSDFLNLLSSETIISAHLYWSANTFKDNIDLDVKLNNIPIYAERSNIIDFNILVPNSPHDIVFYNAYADVTDIVKTTGNSIYTLSDLNLINSLSVICQFSPYYYSGWALIIIYENPNYSNNSIYLYEGFKTLKHFQNLNLNFDGFSVSNNIGSKIGFVSWQGESEYTDEYIEVNNIKLSNPINPIDNIFNGTNSFKGTTNLWNVDLDFFEIQNCLNIGDTNTIINVSTNSDIFLLNSILLTIPSNLPDIKLTINHLKQFCNKQDILVDFTIENLGDYLFKKNATISYFINNDLIFTETTNKDIQINSNIDLKRKLKSTSLLSGIVDVKVSINYEKEIHEKNYNNNTDIKYLKIIEECIVPKGISPNGDGLNDRFDLTLFEAINLKIYNRYGNLVYEHKNGYTNEWYGQNNQGEFLPSGTYYYDFTTPYENFTGYVELINSN